MKHTIYHYPIALLIMVTNVCIAQTTVRFSEPTQFFNTSGHSITVTILVDNIRAYSSEEPVMVQLFSDLKETSVLGISTTRSMDRVIFPKEYKEGEEIQIAINPKALKNRKSFTLFLRKKEADDNFSISQHEHTVIVNRIRESNDDSETTSENDSSSHLERWAQQNSRYSFYVGGNLDFKNDFQLEEAYYEVDVSLYNLFKDRWGLRAGIYKSNNSRSLEDKFRYEWEQNDLQEYNETEAIYTRKVLDVVANVSTESLGFYFQLPYKVIESGNFRAFVSPHIELIKRIEKYSYEVVGEGVEETIIAPIDSPIPSLKHPTLWLENTEQYWDSYLGVGFPMMYNAFGKGFEVFMSPVLGGGFPRRAADIALIDESGNSGIALFGAFQFYLAVSVKDSLGFKLGTDVRKYFYTEQQPIITVNLSTKLDLSKIMNLAGGQ